MADRKAWELTGEEVDGAVDGVIDETLAYRILATAAARKALEWAAKQASNPRDLWAPSLANYIRKELSDG